MSIYICIGLFFTCFLTYLVINAKKTNERNIKVGSELVSKEINEYYKKINNKNFDKKQNLLLISEKIDYFKQSLSVLKVLLVKKEIDKSQIKKTKILRVIILSELMNYIHLYQEILSDTPSESNLKNKINNISLSDIGSLDIHLNDDYNKYKNVFEKKNEDIPLNKEEETLDNFMQYYKTFIIKEINESGYNKKQSIKE